MTSAGTESSLCVLAAIPERKGKRVGPGLWQPLGSSFHPPGSCPVIRHLRLCLLTPGDPGSAARASPPRSHLAVAPFSAARLFTGREHESVGRSERTRLSARSLALAQSNHISAPAETMPVPNRGPDTLRSALPQCPQCAASWSHLIFHHLPTGLRTRFQASDGSCSLILLFKIKRPLGQELSAGHAGHEEQVEIRQKAEFSRGRNVWRARASERVRGHGERLRRVCSIWS